MRFDAKRYWREPMWLRINYLITDGLRKSWYDEKGQQIESASHELFKASGFAEYYDPKLESRVRRILYMDGRNGHGISGASSLNVPTLAG